MEKIILSDQDKSKNFNKVNKESTLWDFKSFTLRVSCDLKNYQKKHRFSHFIDFEMTPSVYEATEKTVALKTEWNINEADYKTMYAQLKLDNNLRCD